jgi:hypothetical protein
MSFNRTGRLSAGDQGPGPPIATAREHRTGVIRPVLSSLQTFLDAREASVSRPFRLYDPEHDSHIRRIISKV